MNAQVEKFGYIRTCNQCGIVNAVSVIDEEETKKALALFGSTVKRIPVCEFELSERKVGSCECIPPVFEWVDCSEEMPETSEWHLVTYKGCIPRVAFLNHKGEWNGMSAPPTHWSRLGWPDRTVLY